MTKKEANQILDYVKAKSLKAKLEDSTLTQGEADNIGIQELANELNKNLEETAYYVALALDKTN